MARLSILASVALALAAAAPCPAGEEQRPEFAADVTLVTVPVFVTDAEGRPVTGLSAGDFEVSDNKKRMTLVGFQEVDVMSPQFATQVRQAPAARRQFLLLFDLSFTGVAGLVRGREAAQAFVGRLEPHDLCAVATFSANAGIRVLVGFTSDRAQLRHAVDGLGILQLDRQADPLGLVYDLTEVGAALADTPSDASGGLDPASVPSGDTFAAAARAIQIRYEYAEKQKYRERVMALFEGLSHVARSLDAVQGRKQVILLSSGFASTALFGEVGQRSLAASEAVSRGRLWEVSSDDRFGDAGLRSELERSLKAFSTSDAVVHAVDLSGLSARGDLRQPDDEPLRRSGADSLERIANGAGGRFFKNTNNVGLALAEVLEMSRHYYLLAFEPQQFKGAGAFHALKVKPRMDGTRVSHRSGYFERQPYQARTPLARQFEAAEVIGKGIAGGDLAVSAMAIPYRRLGDRILLPVVLELDGSALLDQRPAAKLNLEIYGYALDPADGSVQDLVAFFSSLDLARLGPRIREHGIQCHLVFSVRAGPHQIRLLVRDGESGRTGSRWLEVTVPALDPGGLLLYPPIFMADPGERVILEASSKSAPKTERPFSVASDAFAPRTRPSLVNGRPERVCLMAHDGGALYDPGASFDINAQLVDSDGRPVPFGGVQLARSTAGDGLRRFVITFTPTALDSGDYTFKVRLRDPASGQVGEAYQAVRVE